MTVRRTSMLGVGMIAAIAVATAAAAAVPPYADNAIHPTEAEFQQSIAVYRQAVAASDQDADAYYWLGAALWQASVLYRDGSIPYGDGYLDQAIAALERAVALNPKNIGAWLILEEAYYSNGDVDKSYAAGDRLNQLGTDLGQYTGALPPLVPRGGPTVVVPLPAPEAQPATNPGFRAGDYTYAGDPATKKLYPLSCPRLPSMAHVAIFLNKWDGLSQGYTVAPCP